MKYSKHSFEPLQIISLIMRYLIDIIARCFQMRLAGICQNAEKIPSIAVQVKCWQLVLMESYILAFDIKTIL